MPDTPVPSPAATAVAPDQLLAGRYRLRERLARGGMAEVWHAEDEVLARPVAVKLLLPHLAANEQFVTRFRAEAVAAARLSHPHIVAIFDTFSEDGVEAIVMELVTGPTLRRLLDERGALSLRRVVATGVAVAEALEHAHGAGLVHRDVKPGNILVAPGGRVVVTDFGIAKAAMDSEDTRADLTEAGTVMGTAKYLSPEQLRGGDVDARSDVYSLGCVLYEMLCGRPPFSGETAVATAMARLHDTPLLPRQCRPGIPRGLESVVLRALALDPSDRYLSAGDLAGALRSIELTDVEDGPDEMHDPVDVTVAAVADRTPPGGMPAVRFTHSERPWIVPTVVIVTVAMALGAAGILLGRTEVGRQLFQGARQAVTGGDDSTPAATVVDARPFDPFGSGGEHDGEKGRLVDGDPATAWSTEGYDTRFFGGLKDGLGVIVELDRSGPVGSLVVRSPTRGWAAQVYVADAPGDDLAAWGEPAAAAQGIDGDHTFDLGEAAGGAVLLWITDLGDGPPQVRLEIGELSIGR